MPSVLYGCATWSLTLTEEQRLRVSTLFCIQVRIREFTWLVPNRRPAFYCPLCGTCLRFFQGVMKEVQCTGNVTYSVCCMFQVAIIKDILKYQKGMEA
jgi:hypothetical protein